MNQFNEHQLRLWKSMIDFVDSYVNDKITFIQLVSDLHGALQAGEFKDQDLLKQWYDLWGALETHHAVSLDKGGVVVKKKITKDIQAMRNFLEKEYKLRGSRV